MIRQTKNKVDRWVLAIVGVFLFSAPTYAEEAVDSVNVSQLITRGIPTEAIYKEPFIIELTVFTWFLRTYPNNPA